MTREPGRQVGSSLGLLIGPSFFVLAAWLAFGPPVTTVPELSAAHVSAQQITTAPRRTIIGDPPTIMINDFERMCSDCHQLFPLGPDPIPGRRQHEHVKLEHGINDQCRNCHDTKNMNRLVLYSGESISYSEVTHLCQKCHGPTYHDWEAGIHGRVNGYWDPAKGEPRKLKCIQCHNPHRPRVPAMDPLAPLPGPHTLRMGKRPDHEPKPEADPLRRSLERSRDRRQK